jgi:dTDP-4-amino-4,6-dideoxygalactose transaminase
VLAEVAQVIDASAYVNGPQIVEFEEAFATYCNVRYAVGVASGLDALRLALLAIGTRPGDGVVVPANTFVATFEAVTQVGGVPIPVDATYADYNIDVASVEAVLSPKTRIVLPVHLYGQMADMRALAAVAERRRIDIVEDACQAHGARRAGITAGSGGRAAAFSFYPAKNLGAMGDAGATTTNDPEVAAGVRELREHGQSEKYRHRLPGYTARLDSIQALVLVKKLARLTDWNRDRQRLAAMYAERLRGVGDLRLPPVADGSEPVWHVYAVWTDSPNNLGEFLAARGITTARHYPEPAHLSPAYASLGYRRGAFPVAEDLARHLVSLPLFPGLSDDQLDRVVEAITDFFCHGCSSG